jgi:hypothetical protein
MAPLEANFPRFDLDRCRHLVIVRPVVDVREDDVTAAFGALADKKPGLEDKGDFDALARLLGVLTRRFATTVPNTTNGTDPCAAPAP